MGKDLGTYYVRVEFNNALGFIYTVLTGARYMYGTERVTKLDAMRISPAFESEEELISTTVYMFTDGNNGCDCNKASLIADAHQENDADEVPCGDEIELKRLTLIRPDGTEQVIYP